MIAWLLSWLPSWATTLGAGGVSAVGFGLLLYSILPFCKLPRLAAAGGIVCLGAACYLAGIGSAQSVCEAAELRRQINTEKQKVANLERDLSAARSAADAIRKAKEVADAEAATQKERADEYEADLARRPERACPLDDVDVRGLRNIQRRRP